MPRIRTSLVATAFLCAGGGVQAADMVPSPLTPAPASGWIVTLGAAGAIGPKYDGANKAGPSGMPSLSWRRVGEEEGFSSPDDGLDYALFENKVFSFGPVASFRAGRYSGMDNKLLGLRDVPWTVEAGAFAEFWPIEDRLRTRIEVRQGFHGHHGVVAELSADWVEKFGNFTLSGGPRLSLGNGAFMQRNFGVSLAESTLNGIVLPFRAKAGVKSAGAGVALDYRWSPTWTTMVFAKYERLVGDAGRSPIAQVIGQRDQVTFGLGATYSFQIGG